MLKMKINCLQEKHTSRKQIRIIQNRILLRKFGYLFFRKTISNILPSVAQSHYLNSVKRNAFLKLKINWYNERIEWKYNLRAKLHHNFVLKKQYFKKLALFYVKKKTKRVKATIAQIMFEKNFEKQILKFSFVKWKRYINHKKNKNLKNQIANQHFKLRSEIGRLRPYFFKWRIFMVKRKEIRLKIRKASGFYDNKLLSRTFNAFFSYIQYRGLRKMRMEDASQFYSRKLKGKTFTKLMSHRTYKLFQKDRNEFVNLFYERKLFKYCMAVLWKNVERNKYKRERLARFNELQSVRMKKYTLNTWQYYILNKKQNNEKLRLAHNMNDFHNKRRFFRKLKMYRIYKKEKRIYRMHKGTKISLIFQKIILNGFFNSWKNFTNIQISKKEKVKLALVHYELKVMKIYFHMWLTFKDYKKNKRYETMELNTRFNSRLLQSSFRKWKSFIDEKRLYGMKLAAAKKYYRDNLIRANITLIIETAARIKDERLVHYLENEKSRMILAQKYLRIWKIKSKNSKLRIHSVKAVRHNVEEVVDLVTSPGYNKLTSKSEERDHSLFYSLLEGFTGVFQWDPMCFAEPRIPDYMNS